MSNQPFVAIWMVTYNHESYIAQAIKSIINQKTNFTFKLFIGEDCSNDKTREICTLHKNIYPEQIELIFTSNNNIQQNSKNIYDACSVSGATYIAMCEGDDYWTDPFKLQKQVDFLENNPDFAICHHKVKIIKDTDEHNVTFSPLQKDVATFEDLCKGNFIHTVSCVLRNDILGKLPSWQTEVPYGDWALFLLAAQHGKIKYLNEPMATYRRHDGGIYTNINNISRSLNLLKTAQISMQHFDKKYKPLFYAGISKTYVNLIKEYKFARSIRMLPYFIKLLFIRKYHEPPLSLKQLKNIFIG